MPTLLLLDRLFAFLADEMGGDGPPASDAEWPSVVPETTTEIHLQDYNRAVLELVTFPNVLLAWCTYPVIHSHPLRFPSCSAHRHTSTDVSPLSAQYRASAPDEDSDSDSDDRAAAHSTSGHGHQRRPGALTVTPALLAAFKTSLDAHKVSLRFFSGGWTSLRAQLAHWGGGREVGRPPYDVVLASETIYRTDALGPFLGVLRAATAEPGSSSVVQEVPQHPMCLVAAKVLYFGVGGGVQAFVRAVEDERGTVHTVWEHREGVGRRIMQVKW